MQNENRYAALLDKWENGTISQSEKEELLLFLADEDIDDIEIKQSFARDEKELRDRIMARIHQSTQFPVRRKLQKQRAILAAAAVLFVIACSVFYLYKPRANQVVAASKNNIDSIKPGDNKAVLTLADGTIIELDSANNIALAQSQSNIRQMDIGILQVGGANHSNGGENILNTPKGGQYKIVLSDGTQVWLNAASSLHFPGSFSTAERKVSLEGEAYFEVAKDAKHPFIVNVADGSEVKVLGTHFNVMSYPEENHTETTLLEGSVEVKKQGRLLKLQPGEQARSVGDEKQVLKRDVDLDAVVAWKNGVFSFDNADVKTVMTQLARWYDIEVVYKGKITSHFVGTIPRSAGLSEVLQMLELTGTIHFTQEGKIITVSP